MTMIERHASGDPAQVRVATYRSRLEELVGRFPVDPPSAVLEVLESWARLHWLLPGDAAVATILDALSPEWAGRAEHALATTEAALLERLKAGLDHGIGRLARWAGAALFATPATAWALPLLTAPLAGAEVLALTLYVHPELVTTAAVLAEDWGGSACELLGAARAITGCS